MILEKVLCAFYMEPVATLYAWCVLPNHWHALVSTDDLKLLVKNNIHPDLSKW